MLTAIFVFFAATLVALLGLFVIYRNLHDNLRLWFFFFCLSLSFWQIIVYASDKVTVNPLLFNRLTFIGPMLSGLFLWLFISEVRKDAVGHDKNAPRFTLVNIVVLALVFINIIFAFTPLIVSGLDPRLNTDGLRLGYDIQRGIGYYFYIFSFLSLAVIALIELISIKKKTKSIHSRTQINTILLAILITAAVGAITSIVLPLALKSSAYSYLGSFSILIFSFILSFAIIRYKVIDVQVLVARSLAYFASLAFVAIIFTAFAFLISSTLFTDAKISTATQVTLAIFSAIAALSFQPIKRLFDKISNNLFYRDAYISQDVINKINATLVNETNLEVILSKSAQIIENELKITFCEFYLDSNASIEFHLAGTNNKLFANPKWELFIEKYQSTGLKNIVSASDKNDVELNSIMRELTIAVAIKMIVNNEEVGLILFGDRRSGNGFADQDIQLLEIVADSIAIAVQNSLRYKEISQFNITLQNKIDAATSELQKSNEKLKALDEAKDEFISMASHQLRTPLTSVKGYLSMMLEGDAGEINDSQRRFLDQAFISSQRMVYLIADLLNVSRLRTGKFVIEPKSTYLPDVVESEVNQLAETAKARELKLVFDKPNEFVTLNLDETKIRQVIMNFLDNAIYYTPKGGEIYVDLKLNEGSVEFTVKDSGIGVPKHDQHKLFTKFYRAGNAKKARPDGTGLGLFMAKKVVVAQGGAIIFNTQEGKGSTFGFSFPLEKLEVE